MLSSLVPILVAALALQPAAADWHPGSGIMVMLPPLGNVTPISGVIWGLAPPMTQYQVLILNNAVCNVWWDKGHNSPANKARGVAASPVFADGSFVMREWSSSIHDLETPRFAVFVMNLLFPVQTPPYQNENSAIQDQTFTGAYTWAFADRSNCTDPSTLCEAATWFPLHPPVAEVSDTACIAPPQLPAALLPFCAGCTYPAYAPPPVAIVLWAQLQASAGVAAGNATMAVPIATPSSSPLTSDSASASPSASASASMTASAAATPSASASASASTSESVSTAASSPVGGLRVASSGVSAITVGAATLFIAVAVGVVMM